MLPYWLLLGAAAAGAWWTELNRRDPRGRLPFLLFNLLITLLIGFRWKVGGDWGNYMDMYRAASLYQFSDLWTGTGGDRGYVALNILAQSLDANIWVVNLVCGAILMSGLYRFASRQANPWLALTIAIPYLVIVVGMGYTRQATAIGMVLHTLAQPRRANPLWILLYFSIGALFHKTVAVILPMLALAHAGKRSVFSSAAIIAGSGIVYYFALRGEEQQFLQDYVQAQMESDGAYLRVGMLVVPAGLVMFGNRTLKLYRRGRNYNLWWYFSLAAAGGAVALLLGIASTAVDRLALYLIPLTIAVLTRLSVARGLGGRGPAVTAAVIVYSAAVQFVWLNFAGHAHAWVPFRVRVPYLIDW